MGNSDDYPRVLIIGQTFDKSGGGITLANLFKGWPKDKLAVASVEINTNENSVCDNNYLLGCIETKRPWPFCLLQKNKYSGTYKINDFKKNQIIEWKKNNLRYYFIYIYLSLQHLFGIFYLLHRMIVSDKFIHWVNDFKPDLIYTQLEELRLIRFVNNLQMLTKKPIVIHIMDDWPTTIVKPGLFSSYWSNVIEKEFKELISKSVALMSICQAMSDEYELRYGRRFIPFHNPIDLSMWDGHSRTDWKVDKNIRILYAGRLGKVNLNSLIDICEAVSDLKSEGYEIIFEIRTPEMYQENKKYFHKYKCVELNPYIKHNDIPNVLTKMDILIIPLDFSERNIKFTRYSMPGKTSDYMASGTPVLVYAAPENAIVRYAKEGGWGYIVDQRGKDYLKIAFKELITNTELRERLGKKAIELAFKNHDSNIVRRDFQSLMRESVDHAKQL